jgi:hypothetical protein
MTTKNTPTIAAPIILPALDAYVIRIVKAQSAVAKSTGTIGQVINNYLDACREAGIKPTEQNAHSIKAALASALKTAFEAAGLETKTGTEYANGAGRAFYHGVPWTAALKNPPKWKIGAPRPGEAGAVVETAAKGARQVTAKTDAKSADPMEVMGAPSDAKEGRQTVREVAIGLQRWCNANVKHLDLATREVVEAFRASVEGLAK